MPEDKTGKNQVSLKVDDVMTAEVIAIDDKATDKEAADIIDKNEISCLITSRKGRAIGIIARAHNHRKRPLELLHRLTFLSLKLSNRSLRFKNGTRVLWIRQRK